ncbi:MAG: family 20 glycosylhydrolase [Planctomycetia bacterium]|nr:family 20 glycosylhydrolase [Planctomycetia bacterium]
MKLSLRILFAFLCVSILFCNSAMSFEPIDKKGEEMVKSRLIPYPQKIELGNKDVVLDKNLKVEIRIADKKGAKDVQNAVAKRFSSWFKSEPKIKIAMDPEGYQIDASEGSLILQANDLAGIRYAMSSIRQMAEALPGTKTVQGWFIPEMKVDDYPLLKFRGIHLCWFPETQPARIEQAIRIAAYYKFNYAVIELWGVYPYKALPEFAWAEYKIQEEDIRALVRLSKELGIRLIPQFNLFGHASASRGSTGKHVLLDFHPEFISLFEPDGWTWCLSNPETRKILDAIVLELMDLYDNPEYFHMGCDEASSAGTCKVCRSSDYNEILYNHLIHFRDLLAAKKARPMLWHDMLINSGDPRWRGYTACGGKHTDQLTSRLPKDFIICDWQYSAPKKGDTWPTMDYFNEKGFDLIACPWTNVPGIVSQAKKAAANKYMGVLCTTWHHFYGRNMFQMLTSGSISLWGPERPFRLNVHDIFQYHLRQVGWEMKNRKYSELGSFDLQVPARTIGPSY